MIPIALDPRLTSLGVAGNGPLALRRYRALRAAGADSALLFSDDPAAGAVEAADANLRRALPDEAALAALHVLWIVDLPAEAAEALAARARAARVLVNVEDVLPFCDFHSVAEIRRGDLLLTISTAGAAPGLAGVLRRDLETRFGPEWADRVARIRALRRGWQQEGVTMPEAARRIATLVEEEGWLA